MTSILFQSKWTLAALIGVVLWCGPANDAVAVQEPAASIEDLKAKLTSLQAELTQLKAKLDRDAQAGGDGEQLSFQYRQKLAKTNETIDQLHDQCLSAIEKDVSNTGHVRTVMGILLNAAELGDDRKVLRSCDRLIAAGVSPAYFRYAATADRIPIAARDIFDEVLIRQREFKADDLPRVVIETSRGKITIELFENEAPDTVGNFISLVESGFYQGALFHQVVGGFVAQTGGPSQTDNDRKDPGYRIYCECYQADARPHFSDVVSMAVLDDRDTGGSQFFFTLERTDFFDGKNTVFGRIIDGHNVLDVITRTGIEVNDEFTQIPNVTPDHIVSAKVLRKRDHEYQPKKVTDTPATPANSTAPPENLQTQPRIAN